ncbi:unnamed protein product [Ectocarpus sp. 12 AP-2014]
MAPQKKGTETMETGTRAMMTATTTTERRRKRGSGDVAENALRRPRATKSNGSPSEQMARYRPAVDRPAKTKRCRTQAPPNSFSGVMECQSCAFGVRQPCCLSLNWFRGSAVPKEVCSPASLRRYFRKGTWHL